MFKRKEAPPEAIEEIETMLNKNQQVELVHNEFVKKHLPTAEGVIIIWATKKDFYLDAGGLSLAEIIGGLFLMAHQVEHEGKPRE